MNEIKLDNYSKLLFQNIDDKSIITYKTIDKEDNYFDINFILSDDININAYTEDDSKNELELIIASDNLLYKSFLVFINNEEKIRITSDYVREEYDDLCYIEIKKEINNITIKLVNKIQNQTIIDKFNYVIINRMFDLRSKLDQNNTDYKKRLIKLFEDIVLCINKREKSKQLVFKR